MDATDLKALQAPFKERYRTDPGSAQILLSAEGRLDQGALACRIDTGRALIEAGLHPATGGTGAQACSGDMLLEALVACSGVTLMAVATALGITVSGGQVRASGVLDFRGTLGVDKEAAVGFTRIGLEFQVESDASTEQLESLFKLTKRYCVIYQTLIRGSAVESSLTATGGFVTDRAA